MSGPRRVTLTAIAAILGIAVAAAITWGTSQLVRQHIGLGSEPQSAGLRLLPPSSTKTSPGSTRTTSTPSSTGTQERSAPAATAPAVKAPATEAPAVKAPAQSNPGSAARSTGTSSTRGEGDSGAGAAPHRDD
jgi:hypothetical protein